MHSFLVVSAARATHSEDDVLLKPNGHADRADAFLLNYEAANGTGSSGLLVFALISAYVATINFTSAG